MLSLNIWRGTHKLFMDAWNLLKYLDNHSGSASVVVNVVLTAVTATYVVLTRKMLKEMQKAREPFVVVDVELPDPMLRLIISNLGQSPARDIHFSVLKDLPSLSLENKDSGIKEMPVMKTGISSLAPGRSLKFIVGGLPNIPKNEDKTIAIEVSFKNESGSEFVRKEVIDISALHDVLFESFQDPSHKVEAAIKNLKLENSRTMNPFSVLMRPKTKECPMCAESIPDKARKCSKCGESLEAKT